VSYGGVVPTRGELSVVVREALCKAEHDNVLALAKALAFTVFLSVPALALAAFGAISLLSQPADVHRFFALHQLRVVPVAARHLAEQSLITVTTSRHGVLAILVGGAIAVWTLTTAMTTTMWALNAAAEVRETRSFLRRRLIAVVMLVVAFIGFALSFGLLVLGPVASGWVGRRLGFSGAFTWVWWIAQWPVLIVGLLVTAAVLYDLGLAAEARQRRYLSAGTVVFVALSLAFSSAFAVYVSTFPSYGHTWGSLAGVIVTLTWLWLNSAAFLFGAELNNAAE
jgi:membrane protein